VLSVDDVLHDLVERGGRALRVAARPASVDRVRERRDGHLAHNRRHADRRLNSDRNIAHADVQVVGDI